MQAINFKTPHFEFIDYRNLTTKQHQQIWEARNDDQVRQWMRVQEPFSWQQHLQFIDSLTHQQDRLYWGVFYWGKLMGSIDLNPYNRDLRKGERGEFLFPEYIGCGLGRGLVEEWSYYMFQNGLLDHIDATILKSNIRSITMHQKEGFRVVQEDAGYLYLQRSMSTASPTSCHRTFIIAELSANHNQHIETAIETIKAAKAAGADAIKLQTYTADTITIDSDNTYFQIEQGPWKGYNLYQLYKEAYTPWQWHEQLYRVAQQEGLICFSSPFDDSAIELLEQLGNPIYKIASFEITDTNLIRKAALTGKPLIISTGVATLSDIELAIKECHEAGNDDITLLKCTSAYPASIADANLATITDMCRRFPNIKVGVSDHSLGHTIAVTAVALGATVVEKHLILDRSMGGADSGFSMQPEEFKEMVIQIRTVEKALGHTYYPQEGEEIKGREFSRSLFICEDMEEGDILTIQNLRSIRPYHGIHPQHLNSLLGKRVNRKLEKGTPMQWEWLE